MRLDEINEIRRIWQYGYTSELDKKLKAAQFKKFGAFGFLEGLIGMYVCQKYQDRIVRLGLGRAWGTADLTSRQWVVTSLCVLFPGVQNVHVRMTWDDLKALLDQYEGKYEWVYDEVKDWWNLQEKVK